MVLRLHFAATVRSIVALTAVALTSAAVVVHQLPDGDAYAAPLPAKTKDVHSISIDGGIGIPLAELRGAMETKLGEAADTATLERDRIALERTLAERGYLAAKVASPIVTYGPSGGTYIVFDVERGPLYHVRDVHLAGPSWSDAGIIPLVSGDDASTERLEKVRQAAQATLDRHGKQLRVELAIDADHADAMIDVHYTTR